MEANILHFACKLVVQIKSTLKSQFVSLLLILNHHNLFQFATSLTGGSFDEARMLKNVEACEWLTGAIYALEVPNVDPQGKKVIRSS